MITFSFYKVSERKPNNKEEIVILGKRGSFNCEYFEPKVGMVAYSYLEVDEDGIATGVSCSEPMKNSRNVLFLYCGDTQMEPDTYWCSLDEYWKAIDNDKEMKQ